jgi:effector-binding domain-containing protein
MGVLKKIVIGLVILVVALVVIAFLLPGKVHVERSVVISARPATVFALVNGFRRFNEWSPWAAMDTAARYAYQGPVTGVGAKMSWVGNPKTVGTGSQSVLACRPYEMVRTALDFGRQGKATADFTLKPEGQGTRVTWGLDTDLGMNPIARYFGLMFDSMVGKDYERGLAGLKALAEQQPKTDFSDLVVEETEVQPVTVAYVATRSSQDSRDISARIATSYARIGGFMGANGLKQAGPARIINTMWDQKGYLFDAAIPVDREPAQAVPDNSPVKVKKTYAGRALKVVLKGPYSGMPAIYEKLMAYAEVCGYQSAGPTWDEYISNPADTPEAELTTNIYMPVK